MEISADERAVRPAAPRGGSSTSEHDSDGSRLRVDPHAEHTATALPRAVREAALRIQPPLGLHNLPPLPADPFMGRMDIHVWVHSCRTPPAQATTGTPV
ncbi:hypothetical protein [Streptomyces sp. NPDC101776]|uniref:hypothetical protein n=1 Tax=Streptomyces sp. NPDC101776 TaxID=3366146 RepID=UPI00382048F4